MMAVYDQHDYMDERRVALNQLADKILKLAKTDDAVLEKMDREGMPTIAASVPRTSGNKSAVLSRMGSALG